LGSVVVGVVHEVGQRADEPAERRGPHRHRGAADQRDHHDGHERQVEVADVPDQVLVVGPVVGDPVVAAPLTADCARETVGVERIVVLGPGGAGKSVLAAELGAKLGLTVIELDRLFWSPELEPLSPEAWTAVQTDLAAADGWIMDGDLGPYDVLAPRLRRADTVIVLDLPRWLCAWRAVRRSRQWRLDFWRWLLTWRRRYRPLILRSVAEHAPHAELVLLRSPRQLDELLGAVRAAEGGRPGRRASWGRGGSSSR
jgi:hypothetical protein